MAAVTVASREDSVFGNKRIAIYKLTACADTNTLDTGFNSISAIFIQPEITAGAAAGTVSGSIITFDMGATANCWVLVIGS